MNRKQIDEFNRHLNYIQNNSPYYKRVLAAKGMANYAITKAEDIAELPITSKDELAAHNDEMRSCATGEIRDIVTTSGTLGSPVTIYVTDPDLDRLARNEAGSYRIAGCDSSDVFQLMTTIDKRFMAGLAYFLGVRKLGASIVRSGPGALELQWDCIERYNPTVLIAVPSFIPKLLDHARAVGKDPNLTSVKKIIAIGEPVRNDDLSLNHLAKAITNDWNVKLYSTYASTEMATAFTECEFGQGVHVQQDLIHLEVLDPNNRQVDNGEVGEVVTTPLGVEGVGLLRYRTGDICRYYTTPCKCGMDGPRLGPVIGRKQQLLKLKGTSVYPNVVIDMLNKMNQVNAFLLEAYSDVHGLDNLRVIVNLTPPASESEIETALAEKLRVRPRVSQCSIIDINKKKFNENARKPKIFFDLRNS